ncbi:hypothetical protein C1922_02190 [Stenotrophomonas sp. ZAC14D2_NAIMI4_7]|uniref:sensor histidine kinase n=1 Tax=Stenotrophomonas sp. ZAC14D2_NAIMI4_7 TaxID=2072405 RepID=UPI000D53CC9A|nr:sensor histidine kinase [Stenotrophomonas sp. ZAC14D2_NAIMI4_7]AWH16218.1 hypothetical protein C1922_02190 [Stenotrophomonas sp. ZAC14D2_NAIMI4_7]
MKKTLSFRTNTLLKNLVGKDLINDDNIAIVELVKNSYDASSPAVTVEFSGLNSSGTSDENSKIIITDSGIGMSLEDINDKWLNIAYSEKKNASPGKGNYYAGNKGVGRFSCDRLGAKLDLLTRAKNGDLIHLPIDWEDFEVEGNKDLVIQDIPLFPEVVSDAEAESLSNAPSFPRNGTVLVISKLRSSWDRERLLDLKRSLEKFLNPNQLFQNNRFKVSLIAKDLIKRDSGQSYHNSVNGDVQNQVFEKLKFNTTYIDSRISVKDSQIVTELHHEGELVFRLTESNSSYPDLEDAKVVVYYLNPYKKAYFTRQTGIRSIEFGSIFLFLNGFRIAPYGDRGDDWLGLDVRKTQGTTRYLSSRDIVGRIEISDSGNSFEPVSSREGLKNTEAFRSLKDGFFLDTLRKLERFVVDGLDWDSVPRGVREELRGAEGLDWENTAESYVESREKKQQRIALSIMSLMGANPARTIKFWFNPSLVDSVTDARSEDVKVLLADIEKSDPGKAEGSLISDLSRIRTILQEKEEAARSARRESAALKVEIAVKKQEVEQLSREKETYRAQTLFMQSVAPTEVKDLLSFHHQISQDSVILGNYIGKAINSLRGVDGSNRALEALEKATLANSRISSVAQFASKANFRSGLKKELTDVAAFFEQYLLNIAKDFTAASLKLSVTSNAKEPFEIKASRIELSILIDNIISNSVKALAKKLDVEISQTGENRISISFRDDGNGLSKEVEDTESIFEIGVTTTAGSGLGLYHARRIVESMYGTISAFRNSPRGMEFRLELMK